MKPWPTGKLLILKDSTEVWLTVDDIVVWQGWLTDWSFALANPWSPSTQAAAVEAPCDVEDSA